MSVVEITGEEFGKLCERADIYFANGCLFDEETDNLVAFERYESGFSYPDKYYKVVKKD